MEDGEGWRGKGDGGMLRTLRRVRLRWQRVTEGFVVVAENIKVATLKFYHFSATKQDKVGPSLQSRHSLFTSAACCTHCTVELVL